MPSGVGHGVAVVDGCGVASLPVVEVGAVGVDRVFEGEGFGRVRARVFPAV